MILLIAAMSVNTKVSIMECSTVYRSHALLALKMKFLCCCSCVNLYLLIDDCTNAADCSNNGKCVDIQATGFPTKQCFCNSGWFGRDCSKRKKIQTCILIH